MFIIAPMIQFLLVRYVLPMIGDYYPVIKPYSLFILLLVILQLVAGIGFVISSIMLDERDEEVLSAIRILPISSYLFLDYRLLFAMTIAFVFGLIMLKGTGLFSLSWGISISGALLFALITPIVLLTLTTFSRNKVECLAVYKGLNLILTLPVASYFLPSPYGHLLSIIPTYWSFQAFDRLLSGDSALLFGIIAFVFHFLVIAGLAKRFRLQVL